MTSNHLNASHLLGLPFAWPSICLAFMERIERLEEEKRSLADDIRQVTSGK